MGVHAKKLQHIFSFLVIFAIDHCRIRFLERCI